MSPKNKKTNCKNKKTNCKNKKTNCSTSRNDKIMIRLLQVIAVVCLADMAYVLWRCMG
jgi:hypothetical protein